MEEKTRRDIPRTNRKMPHTRKAYGRLYIMASESVPNTDLLVRVSSTEVEVADEYSFPQTRFVS